MVWSIVLAWVFHAFVYALIACSLVCLWCWLGFHGRVYGVAFFSMCLSMLLACFLSLVCDVELDLLCFPVLSMMFP